ncbi:a disintegrin and metalloproteinase with thrombospondin motifs 5 [Caerostris darwini]|uniref:A disintegrin and metalloproteinase with thrombospondin motifs 5 n=1 Tax=Caerostris darwini TaxID=1538125 RepID=A0AAV4NTM5_9ARAC|nr:a disintegrin and metalloproteinase with thrombospondin motifs 5 [Caerostris darwini]
MLDLIKSLLLLFNFIIFVNAATLYTFSRPIHMQMSVSQLQNIFGVDSYEKVPEYEVVILRSTKEGALYNEVKSFNLTVFGRDIALRLEPNTFVNDRLGSMKVYKANINDNDLQFIEVVHQYFPWEKSFQIYEDVAKLASVSIQSGEDEEMQMEGSIGDLIIKPVPTGLVIDENVSVVEVLLGDANHTQRTKVNDSSTTEFSTSKGSAHLIYKGQILKPDTDVLVDGQDVHYEMNKTIDELSGKSRREVSVVYPEVLFLLADDIYDSFGGNTRKVIKRYTNFMNEVNMRFQPLSNPRVVLSLVGIVAAQQIRQTIDFRNYSPIPKGNGTVQNGRAVLVDFFHHLYKKPNFPPFDIALIITKHNVCSKPLFQPCGNRRLSITTRPGTACRKEELFQLRFGIVIVKDYGGFHSINAAVHEIGHLLGAHHDGGHRGKDCPAEGKYIMNPALSFTNQWSPCSIRQIRRYLKSSEASCLYNVPRISRTSYDAMNATNFPN